MVSHPPFAPVPRVEFRPVTERHERILIVATGTSLWGFDLSQITRLKGLVYSIAVNGALKAFTPDAWFTLDPSPVNRALLAETRPSGVSYYMAVPGDYGMERARVAAHVPAPEEGVHYLRRRAAGRGAIRGLSRDPHDINTGNSAYGALGLAFHMWPKKVGLLGVDGTTSGYAFGPGRPGDLSHLPELFASAVPDLTWRNIDVANGSRLSTVDCFPRMGADNLLRWLVT